MTKLYLEAVRALPKKWVVDGTYIAEIFDERCVAAHPKYAPIMYQNGKWRKLNPSEPVDNTTTS